MSPERKKKRFIPDIIVENTIIRFRNLSGKEGKFNKEGERNFCVFLEAPIADKLKEDGWNIKWLKPRDEGETEQAYIKVKVSYKNVAPHIFLVRAGKKRELDEEDLEIIDWAEIEYVDLTINPYQWEVGDKSGITAYVKDMYVNLKVNHLEMKYIDVPDSAVDITIQEDD